MSTDTGRLNTAANQQTQDFLTFLIRLARPGAQLKPMVGGGMMIGGKRTTAKSITTAVAAEIVQAARAAGFLTVAPGTATVLTSGNAGPSEVLSPAGRMAVRAALMAEPVQHGDRQPAPGKITRRAKIAAQAGAQRAVERMALVEQLAHRRDVSGRPLLSPVQVDAALRFAQDFAIAQMQPRVTARWSAEAVPERRRRGAPGAGVEIAATTAAAQARVRAALALLGGELAGVVMDVCCFERGLESVEAARHWPIRAGRIVLGIALTRLAETYGMIGPAHSQPAAMRQWGEGGFKPTTDAWSGPQRSG